MEKLSIYLAGAMQGHTYEEMSYWRDVMINHLQAYANGVCNLKVINPVSYFNFEEKRHQTEMEVMKFDLCLVKNSNVVIVNVKGLNQSVGSTIELYEAWKSGIPVLAYDEDGNYESLHPWIKNCITRVDRSLVELCEYVHDFYMS